MEIDAIATFFRNGGSFMYIILGAFVIGAAIIVERGFILIYIYNVDGKALWNKVSKFIMEGQMDKAKDLCNGSKAPLMRILDIGISASNDSERAVQNAIDEIALEMIPSVDKRIPYLLTLANIATLLGLLGTIHGLIQSFSAVGSADPSQKASLLAGGISLALNTTSFGLMAAIPLLAMYSVLQAKANKIIDEIDEFSVKLLNILHRYKSGIQTQ